MDLLSTITTPKLYRRVLIQCAIILIVIWLCQQVTIHKHSFQTTSNYNTTEASAGQAFFRQLIHDNDSFKLVNEQNICALMHFFFQEAVHNGKPIQFSSGMFVLYDSTQRFFNQLMMAKNSQLHSNEHRSGYIRRLVYFSLDLIKLIIRMLSRSTDLEQTPFIYIRGDESSHFHERGNRHDRWYLYPAYGMDITYGCMPNEFSHLLFGRLKDLSNNTSQHYRGDRIYIKPERYGLQQFRHYLGHTSHYIRTIIHRVSCRFIDRIQSKFCTPEGVFHEWIDRRLIERWTQILTSITTLTRHERQKMHVRAFSEGILEIYRQTLMFPSIAYVNEFRNELEHRYGEDVSFRKGHEIIFTTEQLLTSSSVCIQTVFNEDQQCVTAQLEN